MFRKQASEDHGALTIRRLDGADAGALQRLAQRDSSHAPAGTVYAATGADGSLLAAVSAESGDLVADPFAPTAGAAKLLRLWVRELGADGRRSGDPRALPVTAAAPC